MPDNPQSSGNQHLLLGFLVGAAAGAVLAALITPKRGSELRADLKALGRRTKLKADAWTQDMAEALDEGKSRAGRAGTDILRGLREAVADLKG